ncbi:GNAT family N-acetyltransferase [Methanolobus sp. ZRKC2]|uniref:GNAT family N-acetyltransferase n=1 Tax=Methanolobus sp. ZRKC2 TaxID=3125783 RepID=UPI00324BAE75
MKKGIVIRETTRKDFDTVSRFIELVDNDFYPPLSQRGGGICERVENSLATPDANYLVAQLRYPDISDQLQGFVAMVGCTEKWKREDGAYINFFATHPSCRKNGIGELLYAKLEEKLVGKGFRTIYLCTWSGNKKAMRFYEKLGYRVYSIILNDRGEGINTFNYRKKLSTAEICKTII